MNFITEFFFNLLPGTLFIFAIELLFNNPILTKIKEISGSGDNNEQITLLILLSLGLFIGFIFQELTKLTREWKCVEYLKLHDEQSYIDILDKNKNPDNLVLYKKAVTIMKKLKRNNPYIKKRKQYKHIFHLMHNYLWANGKAEGIQYFKNRLSLWANIGFGVLILWFLSAINLLYLLVLIICSKQSFCTLNNYLFNELFESIMKFGLLTLLQPLAYILFRKYLQIYNDVILKTFVAVFELSKNQSKANKK